MTWLRQQKTGCTSRLQSQIGAASFASFRREKPWRQNLIPLPFFVTVNWSMWQYGQADLCIRIFLLSMSSCMKWNIIKIISPNYTFLPANLKLIQIWKLANECFQAGFADAYFAMPEPESNCNTPIFHYCVNETAGKQFQIAKQLYWHHNSVWMSPVNLMHIFRTLFPKNPFEGLLLWLWQ